MFWAVIRCNLQSGVDEPLFNAWYNREHAPRYIGQAGFTRGWRLRRLDHPAQRGDPGQRYLAIYEVDAVAAFNAALARDFVEGHPWEGWENKIVDWQRTYYQQLSTSRVSAPQVEGARRYWTIVRVDLDGLDAEQEAAFNHWYDTKHVAEVTAFAGAIRAWRMRVAPDEGALGPTGQRYMAVYETDSPDYLPRVRAGTEPWDGVWAPFIRNWEIGFYEQLFDSEEATGEAP
jgi:hypothetical protein